VLRRYDIRQMIVEPQKRLLRHFVGLGFVAHHPQSDAVHQPLMRADELAEGVTIPCARRVKRLRTDETRRHGRLSVLAIRC